MNDTDFQIWCGGKQPQRTIGKIVDYHLTKNPGLICRGYADALPWQLGPDEAGVCAYKVVGEAVVLEEKKTTALDKQVGGLHYKGKTIQPVEYIHANGLGFCEGNVVKYITRWRDKNGIADLEKAKHYIELLIELEQKSKT